MDHTQTIADYTGNFLSQIGYPADIKVEVQFDSAANLYHVLLTTTDPAPLVGYHGDTLSALQLLLGLHLHHQTNEWLNLSLNVNDYRERREQTLHTLADSVVAKVLSTGKAHTLPPLPANERRLIHLYLSEHPQVATSSIGEGRARSIIISPKV